ncbi:uncharacterized protein LOC116190313 [Punica granatum]|uniref:Uncharacterized protein LOC116190313 n=1 Tax=Punica granatum TaxID=22663 RepID=A0A6P8BZW6_PUNGR|nr:uncharacterized protein LOC116190313 [Punica granatum]
MNASTLLQHPSHEHGLVLREFSENLGISFKCHICCLCVEGPAYHCVNCRFFLHKLCAELLPEIQHPCHPQHPLILSHPRSRNPPTLYWSSVDLLRCCGCHFSISEYDTAPIYGCDGCELALHVGCAAATLPPPKDEHEQEEEKIQHFSHEHPLTSFHVNGPNQIDCRACDQKISGPIYGCRSCIFMLHEPCASLPQQILQHPYHPQHPLTLRADFEKFPECKACKRQSWFAYHCNECDYNLHAVCADSIMHPSPADTNSEEDRREILHFSHPHRLMSFHAKVEGNFSCNFCHYIICSDFYGCIDCPFMLHVSCAEIPQQIVHPLHPDCPLTWRAECQYRRESSACYLCSEWFSGFGYNCEQHFFHLHARCACSSLSALKEGVPNFQRFHEHPMRLSNDMDSTCKLCNEESFYGLAYSCSDGCDIMLHETCAELPRELEHPFHPQHLLVLLPEPMDGSVPCNACLEQIEGYNFYCAPCEFHMHTACALHEPTLKHQRHEHNLTYFGKTGHLLCDLCYNDCSIDLYRCVPCNYNIHCSCTPLPPSVKHELHIHPMVLRDRVVDEFYDDQYCDLCETTRNPEHGVYYCDECRCAAHIDCVIPKVDLEQHKLAEDLMLRKLDEEIASVEAEMEAVKKKLKVLMTKLEGVKKKRNEIASSRMRGEAELDKA